MRVAAAMRVTVAGPDGDATHLQGRNSPGSIDVTRAAPPEFAGSRRLDQAVEPQVVVQPDTHDEPSILQSHDVLRLRLIFLGVEIGRHEADGLDEVAANGLGQATQIRRRGNDADTIASPRWRRLAKSKTTCDAERDQKLIQPHRYEPAKGRPRCLFAFTLLFDPDAFRYQTVNVLLGVGDGADPTVHRDTGEAIGIQTGDLSCRSRAV